ncbi:unnamed protein product [Caenorhabditis angaria]|uniref:Uncharacterized protein n=1 Tax=Caenorhabditis angaria TaxID=860376 RepID=A0A9P1IAT7_9PELO|nr:unnamed protein product [Caenorhabditis angaria]
MILSLFLSIFALSFFGQQVAAAAVQQQPSYQFEPAIQYELFNKRADGYGWNDCEFSPMSCLLRRRRSIQ